MKRYILFAGCNGTGKSTLYIERRFKESIQNLKTAVKICDVVEIFDNTNVFQRVARFESGKCIFKAERCPNWVP